MISCPNPAFLHSLVPLVREHCQQHLALEKGVLLSLSSLTQMYKIHDVEPVRYLFLHALHREVEPLRVPMSVGVVLHEQVVLIRDAKILEGAREVAALELGVEYQIVSYFGFQLLVGFELRVVGGVV